MEHVAKLTVLGGDFVDHPESRYFMGAFTLWGWRAGETKPARMTFRARRDIADLRLKERGDAMPATAMGVGGAVKGALMGAVLGGPAGAVAGAIASGATHAAYANHHNKAARKGRQRFVVTFNDGRRLDAEMDLYLVSGLQNRLLRRRRNAARKPVASNT
jgi:hypothetical protein